MSVARVECPLLVSAVSSNLSCRCCWHRLNLQNSYSLGPVLDAVRFEWTTFNDVFQPDEYSGYPSASSEAAWGKLWDCKFAVSTNLADI